MKYKVLIVFILFSFLFQLSAQNKKESIIQTFANDSLISSIVGYAFYNITQDKNIVTYMDNKNFIPASNMKIFSSYALLKYAPDTCITFYYFFDNDTLHILPMGDPTFLHPDFLLQPAFDKINELSPNHIKIYTNHWDEYPWGEGWEWNDYDQDFMAEQSLFPIYGNFLTLSKNTYKDFLSTLEFSHNKDTLFNKQGKFKRHLFFNAFYPKFKRNIERIPFITYDNSLLSYFLEKKFNCNVFFTDKAFTYPLYIQESYSYDDLIKYYMLHSNNFFAQQLMLQYSQILLGKMNLSQLIDTLQKKDSLLGSITKWDDASGLSRKNLVKPSVIINVLKEFYKLKGNKCFEYFPTSGEGTLTYMKDIPENNFFAKTGSMSNIFCLSGYLNTYTQKDIIAFSILINQTEMSRRGIMDILTPLFYELITLK